MKKFRPKRIRDYPAAIEGLQHRIRLLPKRSGKRAELEFHLVNLRLKQLKSEIRSERRTQKATP